MFPKNPKLKCLKNINCDYYNLIKKICITYEKKNGFLELY